MKKLLILTALLASGCASIQPATVKSFTEIVAKIAFNYSVQNPDQRKDIANYFYSGALFLRSISGGIPLSPEEFQENISKWFPETGPYSDIIVSLSGLYSSFYPQIQGDGKMYLEYLESFAEGLEDAAASIK